MLSRLEHYETQNGLRRHKENKTNKKSEGASGYSEQKAAATARGRKENENGKKKVSRERNLTRTPNESEKQNYKRRKENCTRVVRRKDERGGVTAVEQTNNNDDGNDKRSSLEKLMYNLMVRDGRRER